MTLHAHSSSIATAEQLWGVVSDVTRWPEHLSTFDDVSELGEPTADPIGRRFTVRQPGLPSAVYEITAWAPGSAFTWEARSPGVTTTATHTVTPLPDGSELALAVEWTGPLAGLVRLLAGRKTQRLIDLEAATFAQVAEARG